MGIAIAWSTGRDSTYIFGRHSKCLPMASAHVQAVELAPATQATRIDVNEKEGGNAALTAIESTTQQGKEL